MRVCKIKSEQIRMLLNVKEDRVFTVYGEENGMLEITANGFPFRINTESCEIFELESIRSTEKHSEHKDFTADHTSFEDARNNLTLYLCDCFFPKSSEDLVLVRSIAKTLIDDVFEKSLERVKDGNFLINESAGIFAIEDIRSYSKDASFSQSSIDQIIPMLPIRVFLTDQSKFYVATGHSGKIRPLPSNVYIRGGQ